MTSTGMTSTNMAKAASSAVAVAVERRQVTSTAVQYSTVQYRKHYLVLAAYLLIYIAYIFPSRT